MQKFFISVVCFIQPFISFAQKENLSLERAKFEFNQVVDPNTGKIPVNQLYQAYNATVEQQQKYRGRTLNWIEMGPKNQVGGRIRALLVLPNKRKAFTGGITGGLWVTDDITAGLWRPVNDFFSNLNVSTIACHPTDPKILYFGTGEDYEIPNNYNAATDLSVINQGAGIWKSIDGGATWTQLPQPTTAYHSLPQQVTFTRFEK